MLNPESLCLLLSGYFPFTNFYLLPIFAGIEGNVELTHVNESSNIDNVDGLQNSDLSFNISTNLHDTTADQNSTEKINDSLNSSQDIAMDTSQNVAIETSNNNDVSQGDTNNDGDSNVLENQKEEKSEEVKTESVGVSNLLSLPLPYFPDDENDDDDDDNADNEYDENRTDSNDQVEDSSKNNADNDELINSNQNTELDGNEQQKSPNNIESETRVQDKGDEEEESMDIDNDDGDDIYSPTVENKLIKPVLANNVGTDSASSPLTTDFSDSMAQAAQEAAKYNTRAEFPDESDDVLEDQV